MTAADPVQGTERPRGEVGDTLVEIVVTVMIMSVAVVAIIAGIASAISLSGLHRSQADVSAALVSAAETIKAQGYDGCCKFVSTASTPHCDPDPASTFNAVLTAAGQQESDVAIPTVTAVTNTGGAACTSLPADPGIEMIWLQAASNSGKVVQSLYVVKADN